MLVLYKALYFGGRLHGSLLCPNQLRAAGNIVQDVPMQFDATSSTQSVPRVDSSCLWISMKSFHFSRAGSQRMPILCALTKAAYKRTHGTSKVGTKLCKVHGIRETACAAPRFCLSACLFLGLKSLTFDRMLTMRKRHTTISSTHPSWMIGK